MDIDQVSRKEIEVCPTGIERSVPGITIEDEKNCKWFREQTKVEGVMKTTSQD